MGRILEVWAAPVAQGFGSKPPTYLAWLTARSLGSGPLKSTPFAPQPSTMFSGLRPCNQTTCTTLQQPATCEAPSLKDIACNLHQTHCTRNNLQTVSRVCNAFAAVPQFFVVTVRSQALKHIAAKSFYEASGPDLPRRRRGGGSIAGSFAVRKKAAPLFSDKWSATGAKKSVRRSTCSPSRGHSDVHRIDMIILWQKTPLYFSQQSWGPRRTRRLNQLMANNYPAAPRVFKHMVGDRSEQERTT